MLIRYLSPEAYLIGMRGSAEDATPSVRETSMDVAEQRHIYRHVRRWFKTMHGSVWDRILIF